jgi:N-acetylglucosamine kinase-like BadF-type ATPase
MTTHLKRAVLALDPGGSKCDAVLVRDDGTVIGWGHEQKPGISGRSPEMASAAIARAVGPYTFEDLHVAAYVSGLPPGINSLAIRGQTRVWPLPETAGPLALVGQTHGVVVLAGTGARVSAHTRDGRRLELDALGPTLGDFGSGYSIGLQALRATARAAMHPRHSTRLKDRVLATWESLMPQQADNAGHLGRLVTFSLMPHDRSIIASLAEIVDEEARAGDPVAIRILENAAAAIGETLRDALDHLQIANDEYALVGTGSVATKSDVFWNHLCHLVQEQAPRFTSVRCPAAPVLGNALVVLRELRPETADSIREMLLATAPKGDTIP